MSKRILAVLTAALMVLALAACGGQTDPASAPGSAPAAGNAGGAMTPGTYEGKAQGFGGGSWPPSR